MYEASSVHADGVKLEEQTQADSEQVSKIINFVVKNNIVLMTFEL